MYSSCGCVPQVCISAKFSVNSEICTVWSHCRINPSQTSTRDFFYVFPPWCFPVGFCYQTSPWDCRCAPVWTAQLRAAEDLGISSHILSGSSLVLFHSPITSTVRLCQWSLLLPALIRINPSWCQQAWGCIGCYIVKNPKVWQWHQPWSHVLTDSAHLFLPVLLPSTGSIKENVTLPDCSQWCSKEHLPNTKPIYQCEFLNHNIGRNPHW